MAVLGLKGGSRLRHMKDENLLRLEDAVASLPYKVDIINVHKLGPQWYVHFYIPDSVFNKPTVKLLDVPRPTLDGTLAKE